MRHTAASLMLNHGVPEIIVSKILGHAKPSSTMGIYGHLIHEMQEEAARVMDQLVTPIRLEISAAVENVILQEVSRYKLHQDTKLPIALKVFHRYIQGGRNCNEIPAYIYISLILQRKVALTAEKH